MGKFSLNDGWQTFSADFEPAVRGSNSWVLRDRDEREVAIPAQSTRHDPSQSGPKFKLESPNR
jgi:hypothetical protein